jgi:hypothetical protein
MSSFVVDHIVPRSAGGATHTDNLALACQSCNAHKYNKTGALDPVSNEKVALYHPRQDHFRDHFTWSEDFTLILGITPRGRATVQALHMNHDGIISLRRLLHEAGTHPPREPEG